MFGNIALFFIKSVFFASCKFISQFFQKMCKIQKTRFFKNIVTKLATRCY